MNIRYRLISGLALIMVLFLSSTPYAAEPGVVSMICGHCVFKELQCPLIRQYQFEGVQIYSVDTGRYGLFLPVGVTMKFVPSMDDRTLDNEMLKATLPDKVEEWSNRIGEDCRQWFRSDGGTMLFRRNNVIVKFYYKGDQKSAEDFALDIDNMLYRGKHFKPSHPKK